MQDTRRSVDFRGTLVSLTGTMASGSILNWQEMTAGITYQLCGRPFLLLLAMLHRGCLLREYQYPRDQGAFKL